VIVADPEWQFEPWSRETGMDRAAANHYPTSCLEVIKSRDVPSIVANDCVLFLWATIPMNPHALMVMAAWGFDYKSQHVWGKDKFGTGYSNQRCRRRGDDGLRGAHAGVSMIATQ
jgi:N6-adenosine-specific RNA methylase IME4